MSFLWSGDRDVLSGYPLGCSLGMSSRDDLSGCLSGCPLGMFSRDVLSGCSLGMFCRDVLSGCSFGMSSRDVLSGCSVGIFSRDVLSGCSLGMFSRDVLSGCSLGMLSHFKQTPSILPLNFFFFNTIFVSSHMYPENPEGTQVIVGSWNMGYISHVPWGCNSNLQIVVEANYTALEIKEVFPEDAGTYVVIARNLGGEARTSGLLSIDGLAVNGSMSAKAPSKPYFTQQLQNKDVQEGSRAHFKCEVAGFPEPEVCHTIQTFNPHNKHIPNIQSTIQTHPKHSVHNTDTSQHSIHDTDTSQHSIHNTDTSQTFNPRYRHIPNIQSTIQTHPKHSIHTTDTSQTFNPQYRHIPTFNPQYRHIQTFNPRYRHIPNIQSTIQTHPKLSIHNTDTSQHSIHNTDTSQTFNPRYRHIPNIQSTIQTHPKHSIHDTDTSQHSIHTTDTSQTFNPRYRHIPNIQSTLQTHPKHSIHTTDTSQTFNPHYRHIPTFNPHYRHIPNIQSTIQTHPKLSIHTTDTSQTFNPHNKHIPNIQQDFKWNYLFRQIIWYHNDKVLKDTKDFELNFDGERCVLIIREVYLEDSGEYKCTAKNTHGSAHTTCRLIVERMLIICEVQSDWKYCGMCGILCAWGGCSLASVSCRYKADPSRVCGTVVHFLMTEQGINVMDILWVGCHQCLYLWEQLKSKLHKTISENRVHTIAWNNFMHGLLHVKYAYHYTTLTDDFCFISYRHSKLLCTFRSMVSFIIKLHLHTWSKCVHLRIFVKLQI